MKPAPGLVVAERFQLVRVLGRGGMGSVWQVHDLRLEIPAALKFVEGIHAHSDEMRERFEREAKAAALLRSPHVVQIVDHGIWEGTPYIAMELLEGEDLHTRLARVGAIAPALTATLIAQVARALHKAHQAGIVHRDLKPENVFLTRDDDREIVKVLDFGVAKREGGGRNVTTEGAIIGTPAYMSPEQARGLKEVDSRSDLWSLGVITYECVTGRQPFEAEAVGDLMVEIISKPLPVPSQVAQVPSGFDEWFARACARDPAQRFQTARELSEALLVAVGMRDSHPSLSTFSGVFDAPAKPPRKVAGAGERLAIGDRRAETVLSTARELAMLNAAEVDRMRPRSRIVVRMLVGGIALAAVVGGTFAFLHRDDLLQATTEPTQSAPASSPVAPDAASAIDPPAPAEPPTPPPSQQAAARPPATAGTGTANPRIRPVGPPKHVRSAKPAGELGF